MKKSQVKRLEEYLNRYDYITPLIAKQVLGIERLAARIYDLKKTLYPISKETRKDMSGRRYTRYSCTVHPKMRSEKEEWK